MVQSFSNVFEEWLGDISETDSMTGGIYPFKVRVGVVKMAAPRHERFEYVIEMGMLNVDRVFNGQSLRTDTLTFVFPERHMSVHEQRGFMSALTKHPDVGKIKQVDIITSSPIMISDFHSEMIRILMWPDDHLHNGEVNA